MVKLSDYQKGSIFGAVLAAFAFVAALSVVPIVNTSHQNSGSDKAEHKQAESNPWQKFWDWTTRDADGFFTLGLCVIGAAQALLFIQQLHFMRQGMVDATKAADASVLGAETAQRSLVAANRAWLKPIVTVSTNLNFTQFGAQCGFEIKARNVGNEPATNVTFHVRLAVQLSGRFVWQDQAELCDRLKINTDFGAGPTIFPNEIIPDGEASISNMASAPLDDVLRAARNSEMRAVLLSVYGFIDYAVPSDPRVHHQSPFIFELRLRDGRPFTPETQTVSANLMELLPASGGRAAD